MERGLQQYLVSGSSFGRRGTNKNTVKSDKTNPEPTLQIGLFSGDAADLYWAREPAAEGGSPWARGWLGAMAIPIGFGTLP